MLIYSFKNRVLKNIHISKKDMAQKKAEFSVDNVIVSEDTLARLCKNSKLHVCTAAVQSWYAKISSSANVWTLERICTVWAQTDRQVTLSDYQIWHAKVQPLLIVPWYLKVLFKQEPGEKDLMTQVQDNDSLHEKSGVRYHAVSFWKHA